MDDSKSNKDDSIVQSDGAVLNETEQNKAKENNEKHGRKRKRLFYGMIRRQMEFYLGDANLSKDRFINKLLATSECKYRDYALPFNKSVVSNIFSYTNIHFSRNFFDWLHFTRRYPIGYIPQIQQNQRAHYIC